MAFDRPSYRTRSPEKDRTFPRVGKNGRIFSNPWKTNHFGGETFSTPWKNEGLFFQWLELSGRNVSKVWKLKRGVAKVIMEYTMLKPRKALSKAFLKVNPRRSN